jgi:hypothetical protein
LLLLAARLLLLLLPLLLLLRLPPPHRGSKELRQVDTALPALEAALIHARDEVVARHAVVLQQASGLCVGDHALLPGWQEA